jgi:hypothetical protein
MSVSDPEEKIEWGANSEPGKNERVPSSGNESWFVAKLWLTQAKHISADSRPFIQCCLSGYGSARICIDVGWLDPDQGGQKNSHEKRKR